MKYKLEDFDDQEDDTELPDDDSDESYDFDTDDDEEEVADLF